MSFQYQLNMPIVNLSIEYFVHGENEVLALLGSTKDLGNWNPSEAVHAKQIESSGTWIASTAFPSKSSVEFKWVLINKGNPTEVKRWEERENRQVTLGRSSTINCSWAFGMEITDTVEQGNCCCSCFLKLNDERESR